MAWPFDPYGALGGQMMPTQSPMGGIGAFGMTGEVQAPGAVPTIEQNTQDQTTPEETRPAGGGSIFLKLLYGALSGIAAGAGSENPGEAFTRGAMEIERQRDKERQQMIEDRKLKQQEQLFDAQMQEAFNNRLMFKKQYESFDKKLQMDYMQSQGTLINAMANANMTPLTYRNEEEYLAAKKAEGAYPGGLAYDAHFPQPDGSIITFQYDKTKLTPPDFVMEGPGGVPIRAGNRPWMAAVQQYDRSWMLENDRLNRISEEKRTATMAGATIKAAELNSQDRIERETNEERLYRENSNIYIKGIADLHAKAAEGVTGESKEARADRMKLIDSRIQQLNSLLEKLPKPGDAKTTDEAETETQRMPVGTVTKDPRNGQEVFIHGYQGEAPLVAPTKNVIGGREVENPAYTNFKNSQKLQEQNKVAAEKKERETLEREAVRFLTATGHPDYSKDYTSTSGMKPKVTDIEHYLKLALEQGGPVGGPRLAAAVSRLLLYGGPFQDVGAGR